MPRPKLDPAQRRSRIVAFRVTEAEFLRLAAKASETNGAVNDLARDLTLSRLERIVIKAHTRQDPALIAQLTKLGINLNQLTKMAHLGRVSPRIETLCAQIETLVDDATEKGASA